MRLKTYYGRTQNVALQQAKEELGDNIIMVEARQIQTNSYYSNGDRFYQITVAREPGSTNGNGHPQFKTTSPLNFQDPPNFSQVLQEKQNTGRNDHLKRDLFLEELIEIHRVLTDLRQQLGKISNSDFPEPYAKIYKQLKKLGVTHEVANSLVKRAFLYCDQKPAIQDEDVWSAIKTDVSRQFSENVPPPNKEEQKPRIILLLGPTGVGKTTSIMKLAVNPDCFGKQSVAILSTDTYRMAASEPLKTFSKITTIPLVEVSSPDELTKQIENWEDKDVILIDTPGRGPSFPNYISELEKYISVVNSSEILLVFSLATDIEDSFLLSGMYLSLGPTGLIFTKTDETSRPGKILSLTTELKIPVKYLCYGQVVPKDIREANGETVWECIAQGL